jgi:DNA-binding CsgD family transcriptional regulator
MTLALAILFHVRTDFEWTKYYLTFHVSITVLLVVQSIWERMPQQGVIHTLVLWLIICDVAFMIYFIPYFSTWIIAHPWRNPYKSVFIALAIGFLGLAAAGTVLGFPFWIRVTMALLFLGVFLFTLAVLLKNIRDIKDRDARMISLVCIALSLFMVPFIAADLAVAFDHLATMPIYYFWVSLVILVYLFNYFKSLPMTRTSVINPQQLKNYHITEREHEIVVLIREGLTSKEIASNLSISVSTVNNHIANIYSKTNVSSRIDLLNLLMR